jgi:hypothetical protein
MRYAHIDGIQIEASRQAPRKAFCHACNESVFLRCPALIVPHWVHHPGSVCVHAGSTAPETSWHIGWKATVPQKHREVSIRRDGKLRRADIYAATKTIIELQHSSIAGEEVVSREEFYGKNMFWMFDADGRRRVFTRLSDTSHTKVMPLIAGLTVYKCQIYDMIPGLFDANRAKLIDMQSEVIRIIPHAANSRMQFLCHIQDAGAVREKVSKTCDSETPTVDSFLLSVSAGDVPKKIMRNIIREQKMSSGKFMTDYCPHGYIATEKPRTQGLSPDSWAWIMQNED